MASRFRSLSKPTFSFVKSIINKSTLKPKAPSSLLSARSSPTFSRSVSQLGCLQSLLPLHSTVSSARLTSCLGIDSMSSRSLSQGEKDESEEMGCCPHVSGSFRSLPWLWRPCLHH